MSMDNEVGYIYILTNASFHMDNWVKIGYTNNVERRVAELSRTAVPLPFEVYATYEIPRIHGVKDPDKFVHDIITKLNPDLRISGNKEFFKITPWDAADMLYSIAAIHNRTDKVCRNPNNRQGNEAEIESKNYDINDLFPINSTERKLYEEIISNVIGISQNLTWKPLKRYVSVKSGNTNVLALWPKSGWIEIVYYAKQGALIDKDGTLYDISNRLWSSAQYASRYNGKDDIYQFTEIFKQLKK